MFIKSLKPNVARDRATRMFGASRRVWRRGRLRAVLDFYIPYRLFRVETTTGRRPTTICLALDAVTGRLDPYRFDEAPGDEQIMRVESARSAPLLTDEEAARGQLRERVMRMVFLGGFFKVKHYGFAAELIGELHVPYWIGVYERGGAIELEVIDAVRGRLEGAKIRQIAADWFQTRV